MGEVISVVARRRRWTLEQKLALVEEVSRPGASVAGVADRHGMSRILEKGRFIWPTIAREGVVTLTTAQLAMLLATLAWCTPTPSWKPEIAM